MIVIEIDSVFDYVITYIINIVDLICLVTSDNLIFRSSNFAHDSWKRKLARSQVASLLS